ncbi:uncharacterized protein LOC142988362 [Genypterus blacodes]|uniref:uncharacterized protein LOC142988362 n=1 Tax=Genypterus blacodes TaxID=154954 RepID=UPI003F75E44F
MADPKSSQTAKNVVIAVLTLWSIAALIIIVVWSTSPDLKSSAQCRAELQAVTEKLEGSRVVWTKDRVALEEMVEQARREGDKQKMEIQTLKGLLEAANVSLDECRQENVVLNGNISALQQELELQQQKEVNLTAQLSLQEDHIESLQHNLTQAFHQTASCVSLQAAAESQAQASDSQTKACQSNQQYLKKQLDKCKAPETQQSPKPTSAASPLSGIPVLALLACMGLHLIT